METIKNYVKVILNRFILDDYLFFYKVMKNKFL